MKNIISVIMTSIMFVTSIAYATNPHYEIGYEIGDGKLYRYLSVRGKQTETIICRNNEVIANDIYIETVDSDSIVVAKDESYLVYSGAEGRDAKRQFIIYDLKRCRTLKRVTNVNAYDFFAAYSPATGSLYITWPLLDENMKLTVEYSGENLAKERKFKNIHIPRRLRHNNELLDRYKFSKDNRYILMFDSSKNDFLSIYDIADDKLLFRAVNRKDVLGDNKVKLGEFQPDIANDLILYAIDKSIGMELNLYNYKQKKGFGKIQVANKKGSVQFSSKGDKIIFSTNPDKTTWKKEIIVFDVSSGKELGKTIADEADEIIDVTDDAKNIIYKVKGHQKELELSK